ncbi:MAG TPA: FliH/SctL family protein [Pseudolabrys sp.]|jgi:flagellar assembly protein FliH|nr:FliH/SctL family protein [Pseudolabrys sp.]
MAATAKFLFDEDFAAGEKPTITLVEHERRRADAESVAYRKGFAAGEAKAHTEADQRIAAALTLIAERLDRMHRDLSAVETKLEVEAVDVAVAVAGKLAPELVAREPLAEISALATTCFRHLVAAPHVVVRVGESIYSEVKGKLEDIARSYGCEGRLVVAADANIGPGDCHIEWADGGAKRDMATTKTFIDGLVARYVAARVPEQS